MKTQSAILLLHSILAFSMARVIGQPAPPPLDLMEHSSTSLTATFNGVPLAVALLGSDEWFITAPPSYPRIYGAQAWTEPGGAGYNYFEEFGTDASQGGFLVVSDSSSFRNGGPPVPDGTIISNDSGFNSIRFTDLSDPPTVADVQSTAPMLALCGLVLLSAARGGRNIRPLST